MVTDPAVIVTGKPDVARSASLNASLQNAIAQLEGDRGADGKVPQKAPPVPGMDTKVIPDADKINYCLVVTDKTNGQSKAYNSQTRVTMDANQC